MNSQALQSTLREMRMLAYDARSWIVLLLISLVVGLIGPFGTYGMPIIPRIGYWLAVVTGTAIAGTFCASWLKRLIGPHLGWLVRSLVAGSLAGLPVTAMVVLLNLAILGPVQPIDVLPLSLYCMAICAAVTVAGALFSARHAAAPTSVEATPPLLDRLPLPQRGRLLHLAVKDHYVDVTTDRGTTLVLIRLSDAIRETAPLRGLQVHRSHWVALDAVRRSARRSGKPVLELENGAIVPVSRSFLPEVRSAGLL